MKFPIQSEFNRRRYERGEGFHEYPYTSIPWAMMAPHEAQCQTNHQQSVKRISERGGFSRCEAIAVLEDRKWIPMDVEVADKKLKEMVKEWEDKNL
jgi:hypothetical protein